MSSLKENPKVFISYAWGSKEHQDMVNAFVSYLYGDAGVEVLYDKWSTEPGHDLNAFMERSISDSTVTNVLLLLDKNYQEKADAREGGVGTETQIISAEVYGKIEQSKFVPVIFERGENGEKYIPVYLKGRSYFDLSNPDIYDEEIKRLVRFLYGKENYPKPEKGEKPSWVDEQAKIDHQNLVKYSDLSASVKKDPAALLRGYLDEIIIDLKDFCRKPHGQSFDAKQYIDLYNETIPIRDRVLYLIRKSSTISDSEKDIAKFFEKLLNEFRDDTYPFTEITRTVIHELFLYCIAIMLKDSRYNDVGYLLGRPYFVNSYSGSPENFNCFHARHYTNQLDNFKSHLDQQSYFSGVAKLWIENINTDYCTRDEFVYADLICYNYMFLGEVKMGNKWWFPRMYVYKRRDHNDLFKNMAIKLQSKEHLIHFANIFNVTEAEFIERVKSLQKSTEGHPQRVSYNGGFEYAPLIIDYVSYDKIGIYS